MIFIPKTRVIGLSVGEDFVILACVVFTQCQRVTDGRTDRQTDISIVASTGLAATLTPCKKLKGHVRTVTGNTHVKFEVCSFNRFGAISIFTPKI